MICAIVAFYGYFPILLLGFLADSRVRFLGFYAIACAMFFYCKTTIVSSNAQIYGQGSYYFQTQEIQEILTKKGPRHLCKGLIRSLISESGVFSDVPCSVFANPKILGTRDVVILGEMQKTRSGSLLSVQSIRPVPYTFNLSYLRFLVKKKIKNTICKYTKDPFTSAFLTAFATGDVDNKTISCLFSERGLSHILAISGFHYAYLLLFLQFFLKKLFRSRLIYIFLIILCTAYCFLIGTSPSVTRAWLAITLYLLGCFFRYKSFGLNILGISCMVCLLQDPLSLSKISFQLSYLATFSLLCFSSSMENILSYLLPIRTDSQVQALDRLNQYGYILCNWIRTSLGATLAATLATLPIIFLHFHKTSLVGFLLNLFIPQACVVTMLGLLTSLIPFLGIYILQATVWYTEYLLDVIILGTGCFPLEFYCINIYPTAWYTITFCVLIFGLWIKNSHVNKKNINLLHI